MSGGGFGASLVKSKQKKARDVKARYSAIVKAQAEEGTRGAEPKDEGKKLKSIWETTNMQDFLQIADEREEGYQAARNVRVVVGGATHVVKADRVIPLQDDRDWFKLSESLTIPKRPEWTFKTRRDELDSAEKGMFLEWRRELSKIEEAEKVLMTPYEKNLEVWRQLWRVVERSDLVLEIVDARNPLAFRSVDFENYVRTHKNEKGLTKRVVLLINKSDLLTENQRRAWAAYFTERGVEFFFFAAKPLEEPKSAAADSSSDESSDDSDSDDDEQWADAGEDDDNDIVENPDDDDEDFEKHTRSKKDKNEQRTNRRLRGTPQRVDPHLLAVHNKQHKEKKTEVKVKKILPWRPEELERDERLKSLVQPEPHDIVTPLQLIDLLVANRGGLGVTDDQVPLHVGMVGYPNVGKSSTINAILESHKVVVSSTPGKTKHFQTLTLPAERRVIVCDCPGLVFPSFSATRETMICDGILPVDIVKDYVSPIAVVCQRIPQHILETTYATALDRDLDVDESTNVADRVLNLIARRKGYMTEHDKPNRSRVAREILKKYVDGGLVYVHPPPGLVLAPPEDLVQPMGPGASTQAPAASATAEDAAAAAEEDEEDWEDEEGDAWDDISSADEMRGLSDRGSEVSDGDLEDEDGVGPLFMHRHANGDVTQAELFNLERNVVVPEAKKEKKKKKKVNHQLEPDAVAVRINEDGEREIMIDSDDGIVEYRGPGVEKIQMEREKKKSKRTQRREMRRAGLDVPRNRTGKAALPQ